MRILVCNGPNLNLLGIRRPEVYGSTTLEELNGMCRLWGTERDIEIDTYQSNHEGDLIDRIHAAMGDFDGIILNPGAYTHTSYAIHDAIESVGIPTVEVHISNVMERESWRQNSVVRPACVTTIYGRGVEGYRWAMLHLQHRLAWPHRVISYGPGPDQTIEIRTPNDMPGPSAAVVLIHGGFWRHMWTRDTLDGLAFDLSRRGVISANVEYRRPGLDPNVGPAEMIDDVVAAIRTVMALPEVDRVAVVGHSAGAHLALMAAAESGPAVAASIGGVLDLELAVSSGIGQGANGIGAATAMLGDEDPADWSPMHSIDRLIDRRVDVVVVHGEADESVPFEHAVRWQTRMPSTVMVTSATAGHFDGIDPDNEFWSVTAEKLLELLDQRETDPGVEELSRG